MKLHRSLFTTLLALASVAVLAVVSCSKKDDNPAQPGGNATENFNSGNFAGSVGGVIFVHTYATIGSFGYHCQVHGISMSGTINVVAGTPDSATVTITDNVFTPGTQTVHAGGYIKWINNGGLHSVTSP